MCCLFKCCALTAILVYFLHILQEIALKHLGPSKEKTSKAMICMELQCMEELLRVNDSGKRTTATAELLKTF